MKKLILLHTINQFEEYCYLQKDFYKDPEIKIIAFTLHLRMFLKSKNIQYFVDEEYITEEETVKSDEQAFYFAKNWSQELFKFNNIDLSWSNFLIYLYDWSIRFRTIQTVLNIIDNEEPDEIITLKEKNVHILRFRKIVEYLCEIKKVSFILLSLEKDFLNIKNYTKIKQSLLSKIGNTKASIFTIESTIKLISLVQDLIFSIFKKSKKRILVYRYSHHEVIIPLISKKYNITLLDDRPNYLKKRDFKQILIGQDGTFRRFFDFFESKKLKKKVDFYFNAYFKKWEKHIEDPVYQTFFKYKNIDLWPLLRYGFFNPLFFRFKDFIKFILMSYRILTKKKYDLIIFETDIRPIDRILSIVASKFNIPTLVIQHGINPRPLMEFPHPSKIYAVWGNRNWKAYKEFGLDLNKLVITGCPRFDQYVYISRNPDFKEKIKLSVYKDFKIDKDKKLIVLTTTQNDVYKNIYTADATHLEIEKIFEIVFSVVNVMPNIHLIAKLHPADQFDKIPFQIKNNLKVNNISITKDYNIINLIVACDSLISYYSTTIIEAMILFKPVTIIRFKKSAEIIPIDDETVPKVSNYEELLKRISDSLNKSVPIKKYKEFLQDYIYKTDGLSTKRVLRLIDSILK